MLEHIYVVVGCGSSDIGKGWLTGSIASVLPNALPVKIDPLLNSQFPSEIGITIEGKVVSDDLSTYRELGLPVHPDFNILGGALLLEFLQQPEKKLGRGSTKKLTLADVSNFLADKLLFLTSRLEDCRNLVVEVGGIITDAENTYIPAAIKILGFKTGITPEMVILGCLEYAEFGFTLKTQNIRYAIRETRRKYSLPIKACFVRRRYVPEKITDEQIKEELVNIAFETQMPSTQVIYEANFASVHDLRNMVEKTGIFKDEDETYLASACLLGIPCRYDGTAAKVFDQQKALNLFKKWGIVTVYPELLSRLPIPIESSKAIGREGYDVFGRNAKAMSPGRVVIICPELLAGLSIPRGPFEIVGGDGHDVLEGNAKVLSEKGNDCTQQFIDGAQKALEIAKRMRVTKARLCDGSPTCGCLQIYDGSFNHQKKPGCGVFAALLERNGIECVANFN